MTRKKDPKKSAYSKTCWLRPNYDLTDVLADILATEADYALIVAQLAGCSMVAAERYDFDVDDNGDDLGDNVDTDDYNL